MKSKLITGLASIAFAFLAPSSQAATLTFDELAPSIGSGAVNIGDSYTYANFTLTGKGRPNWPNTGFYVFPESNPNWTGSAGLTYYGVGSSIELVESNGALFDVESIDISRGDLNSGLVPVDFLGTKADGSKVSQVYWFKDAIHGRNETLVFSSDFKALKSLKWQQGAEWHQFDNLTVNVSTVPEPQTLSLALLGLFGLAMASRKTKQQ